RHVMLAGKPVVITGIAKGAGMIKPDMATMLAYVFTDLGMTHAECLQVVTVAAGVSFNRITIDGDTFTQDYSMLGASSRSGVQLPGRGPQEREQFEAALLEVFSNLAQAIVRDGEGATKFVTVTVRGGSSTRDCLAVAYAISESPLVK